MIRTIVGEVTSAKSDKTITVQVNRVISHPVYKKQYTRSRKFHAHDEKNEAAIGDIVEVSETRPVSKNKTWKLNKIVEKAQGTSEAK